MGGVAWRFPNVRAAFSPAHPLAHRDVPLPRARGFRGRALREYRRLSILFSKLLSPLESCLILLVSLWRSGQVALYCAHRTSTFLLCAFCEQEGHLAVSSLSLPAALTYPFNGSIMLPPSLLYFLSWKGTHVGLRAAVERVYRWSLQARSLSPRDGG
jgi:hypothetical protein